ncbi:hypothetical protein [Curtobacterium pusillum]|uniref:hypothetical protein n=1 Tax=Curtobacterium pusillum TaxID=69373 RepID=UPI0011A35DCE|nr:hypothetical protein [Curtobacterium pusillum]
MTATSITPFTDTPIAGVRHVSARPPRSCSSFSEVRAARHDRFLAASAVLTGIGAVSIAAVATIALSVAS